MLFKDKSQGQIKSRIKIRRAETKLSARLTVRGVQGRDAYPRRAKNSAARASRRAPDFFRMRALDAGNDHFQPMRFRDHEHRHRQ